MNARTVIDANYPGEGVSDSVSKVVDLIRVVRLALYNDEAGLKSDQDIRSCAHVLTYALDKLERADAALQEEIGEETYQRTGIRQ